MRLESGSRLGPYEIVGPIGAGGMGEVYRARDTRLGREVAIKVLPGELSRDAERLARFEREARSSSALNHRNIVTIHDFTSRDGEAWLVMELVRGESLRTVLSRGPIPLKKVVALAAGIADGLAAAHAAGIVHRDLKPENVMVASDGTAKILDFGLVKQAAPLLDANSPTDMKVTHSGMIMGTAAYMSPEQARGEEVDFRTDQFSLGMIVHEMTTGRHPFARPSGIETLTAILNDDPAPLGDAYPEPFVAIVERCLSKNRVERYGSTADLAHDVHRLAPHTDRHAPAPRTNTRMNWWPFAVAALLLAAVATLLTWRRSPPTSTGLFRASIATPGIAHVFRDEVALPLALSPDGKFLVVHGLDVHAVPGLWLHDLRSGDSRQIVQNGFSVGWSSDSRAIAFFADGKLKTIPVEGGPPRIVCDALPESTPEWHGDTILYAQFSNDQPGVYRVNAGGGKPEKIVSPDRGRFGLPWWPQFLPDGKRFLYLVLMQHTTTLEITHELRLGSLDGSPPMKVAPIDSRAVYTNGHLMFVRDGTLLAQPFDPDRARFTGDAQRIVDGLHYFRNTGLAAFSASSNGVLAWRKARRPSDLVWLDRTGIETRAVGTATFRPSGRLSPDGHRYAVGVIDPKQGGSDIWIYDLDRDRSERITFRILDEASPVWAPDGRTIYYRSDGGGGPPDIFRWTPDAEAVEIVYRGPGVEEPHDVSSDGRWLLFVDHRQTAFADIKVLPLRPPGPPRPFVATPFNESFPRFSPDGRWVAYQSDLSGQPEVYVRSLDGTAVASRVSKDGGTRPRWRRDGKELFFLAPGARLMSVTMSGGTTIGSPKILFQAAGAADFEPANDGSRFLIQIEQGTSDPPIDLLINWPERLHPPK